MVVANLKDDIGHFEARRVIKVLKNCVAREYLVFWRHIFETFLSMNDLTCGASF